MDKETEPTDIEEDLNKRLNILLDKFLNERRYGGTYRNLREATCLDHKTLKAIKNNDVNLKNIDPVKLLRLYNFLAGRDNSLTPEVFFEFYGNALNQELVRLYSQTFNINTSESVEYGIEALLDTSEKLKVFSVISCLRKLTVEQVNVLGGEKLLNAANELHDQGALKFEDETYYPNWDSEWVSLSKRTVQRHYSNMSRELDINSREKYGTPHYLFGGSYAWNDASIQEGMEALSRCQRELTQIDNNPRSQGEKPFYVHIASGLYVNDMNKFYGLDKGVLQ